MALPLQTPDETPSAEACLNYMAGIKPTKCAHLWLLNTHPYTIMHTSALLVFLLFTSDLIYRCLTPASVYIYTRDPSIPHGSDCTRSHFATGTFTTQTVGEWFHVRSVGCFTQQVLFCVNPVSLLIAQHWEGDGQVVLTCLKALLR